LAHFTGWGYKELMEMPLSDIAYWYTEAVKVHNKINEQAT
jgi:hypothetical protein